jgi:hypothetical protein
MSPPKLKTEIKKTEVIAFRNWRKKSDETLDFTVSGFVRRDGPEQNESIAVALTARFVINPDLFAAENLSSNSI